MVPRLSKDGAAMKPVTVKWDEELLERIDAGAAELGVTRSEWLRQAAEEKLTGSVLRGGLFYVDREGQRVPLDEKGNLLVDSHGISATLNQTVEQHDDDSLTVRQSCRHDHRGRDAHGIKCRDCGANLVNGHWVVVVA
jgi:hypothetical protein